MKLKQILPQISESNAKVFEPYLLVIFEKYNINTLKRQAAFLANICHECNFFATLKENLNYSKEGLLKVFGKYFNNASAAMYARNPEMIANVVYANRMGNNNIGDGWKYRGRSAIMLTGKANYKKASVELGIDFVGNPELAVLPENVCKLAGWYWNSKDLNLLADAGRFEDVVKGINGGLIGYAERKAIYDNIIERGIVL